LNRELWQTLRCATTLRRDFHSQIADWSSRISAVIAVLNFVQPQA
jgi:hypothetical protein